LFEYERGKCLGILNGIDADLWSPATDKFLEVHYDTETVDENKQKNKEALCKEFNLNPQKPLIIFIGRLVGEKPQIFYPMLL
jgi:starch synthase